jgi:transposase
MTAASHPFYTRLNQLLRQHGFDDFAEAKCGSFYAETTGQPSLPGGIYFRLLLIGYFEGIDSERGIAWRATDSFALRDYSGVDLEEAHRTASRVLSLGNRIDPRNLRAASSKEGVYEAITGAVRATMARA